MREGRQQTHVIRRTVHEINNEQFIQSLLQVSCNNKATLNKWYGRKSWNPD